MVENEKVGLVEPDGDGNDSGPSVSYRRWLLPVAVSLAILVALLAWSTSTTSPTTTVWWGSTSAATAIQADLQSLCQQASPAGPEGLKTVEAWANSFFGGDSTTIFNRVMGQIETEVVDARNAQDARLVGVLVPVVSEIEDFWSAVENSYRYNPDLDREQWTYQMALAERHCANANAAISTLIALGEE